MDIFGKLCRGTNLKIGASSNVHLFSSKSKSDVGTFVNDFSVTDSNGEEYTDYKQLNVFNDLSCLVEDSTGNEWVIKALDERFNFKFTTPIQKHVIPLLLKGEDVVAVAPTGSGKTLAYLVPILMQLNKGCSIIKAVILAPTVELVHQVKRESIYLIGGDSISVEALEKSSSNKNASLVISTPLTLRNLLLKDQKMLESCRFLVLDEVDKLLDDGYLKDVDAILNRIKDLNVQKMIFSSTIQSNVLSLASSFMPNSIHVTIGLENTACNNVEQELVCVTTDQGKLMVLRQLIHDGKLVPPVLIFLQTIERVNDLYNELSNDKINVQKFTSKLNVGDRLQMIEDFRIGKIWIMLCTDILARGIDLKGVDCVVNFDLPLTPQVYINRIGRAGRGLKRGKAITFFTLKDLKIMNHIINIMKRSGSNIPNWLENIKEFKDVDFKKIEKNPPQRFNITKTKKKKKRKFVKKDQN